MSLFIFSLFIETPFTQLDSSNIHVNSSSPIYGWAAENILDGSTDRTPDEGKKCFASKNGTPGWLALNLGSQYLVAQIEILGRNDGIFDWSN